MISPHLIQKIARYNKEHLLRKHYPIKSRTNNLVSIYGEELINFASNDYLCLSSHPLVIKTLQNSLQQFGFSSTSSSLISGYSKAHQEFEEAMAEFLQREKALLFNSGYHANLSVLSTFANRHSTVFADRLSHASLLDGIRLSQAKYYRYQHNDMSDLKRLTEKALKESIFLTESVFSMHGDITPLPEIVSIAKQKNSFLIVDDAHAVGVLGQNGRGILEHYQLSSEDIHCLVTPLGKGFASIGAIVSGTEELIEALLQFARPYRYTTALPAAWCAANLTLLKLIKSETWRREKLINLITLFIKSANEVCLPIVSTDLTPIKSIPIHANERALNIQEYLFKKGFYTACMRPPTVPNHEAMLRISLNCMHTESEILQLVEALEEAFRYVR